MLTPASSGVRVAGRIAYQVAVNTASTGWLRELRSANAIDHILLVAAPDGERSHQTLDAFLTKMIAATGIEAVVVLCGACCSAFGISSVPIEFDSLDGKPVEIFFLIVTTPAKAGAHIQALARISRMLASERLREGLAEVRTPEGVLELFRREDPS